MLVSSEEPRARLHQFSLEEVFERFLVNKASGSSVAFQNNAVILHSLRTGEKTRKKRGLDRFRWDFTNDLIDQTHPTLELDRQ